jgi:polysaccharide biosynthesis protein PslH
MNILQITKKLPFPQKDGESIAIVNLSKGLVSQGANVTLLAMNTAKHFFEIEKIPSGLSHYSQVYTVPVNNAFHPLHFLKSFFSSKPYQVIRIQEPDFESKLIELLREHSFDIIQLESIFLAEYIPIIRRVSQAKIAIRNHNVEALVWERMVYKSNHFLKNLFYRYLSKKIKRYEINKMHHADFLIPISSVDQHVFQKWGYSGNMKTISVGLDMDDYPLASVDSGELSFVGSLDWLPNIQGLQWFIEKVWQQYKMGRISTLHVAGRNMPDSLKNKRIKGVIFHGEIEDAKAFISKLPIMIVPLFSGSGMRIKILEAMALGRVVISTTLGCEGIDIINGENLVIADKPADFFSEINRLLTDPVKIKFIGQNARSKVSECYELNKLGLDLFKFYKDSLLE